MIAAMTNEQAATAFQNARPNLAAAIEKVSRNGGTPITVWRLTLWYTGSTRLARYAMMACKHFQERGDG